MIAEARRAAEEDARRLVAERSARAAAEQSAARLRFLAESSIVLSSSLDFAATLSSLARLCVQDIADWTIVYGRDENGRPRRLDVAHRDPERAALARAWQAAAAGRGRRAVRQRGMRRPRPAVSRA